MANALIAYVSVEGHTAELAQYLAEAFRIKGHSVTVKKTSELKKAEDIQGYDAYLFGCPTYYRDMTQNMKTFLFLANKAGLEGKVGGAFGTYTHAGDAPGMILDTMKNVFKMNVTDLGALNLLEHHIGTPEGIKAGHDYGKTVAEMLE